VKREPAVATSVIASAVSAVALFAHIDLTADQQGAIAVVVTLLAGLFIRSQVTPVP
jgi:hypothetical protein